jgi:hypothetical protein
VSRATDALLDELHALVAGTLKDDLAAAREATDEAGKKKPVPSSLILAAMKFLKDNGIDAPVSAPRFSSLVQELKDIDLDEAERLPH